VSVSSQSSSPNCQSGRAVKRQLGRGKLRFAFLASPQKNTFQRQEADNATSGRAGLSRATAHTTPSHLMRARRSMMRICVDGPLRGWTDCCPRVLDRQNTQHAHPPSRSTTGPAHARSSLSIPFHVAGKPMHRHAIRGEPPSGRGGSLGNGMRMQARHPVEPDRSLFLASVGPAVLSSFFDTACDVSHVCIAVEVVLARQPDIR